MDRLFPDTNALFPASVLDLVLRLTEIGLHEVLWSEELLAEYEEKVIEKGHKTPTQARNITDCIRRDFPECEVLRKDYGPLEASMTGTDPDDHVMTAAAAFGGATIILSSDAKGFPKRDLAPHGIVRKTPDAYLTGALDRFPDEVIETVQEQAADKTNPPMSIDDVLTALERAGCPWFVARFRELTQPAPPLEQ